MTAHHPDAAAVPLAHSVAPIGHDYLNTKGLVYMEDVHNFALQIACGLQHLSSMQVSHTSCCRLCLWVVVGSGEAILCLLLSSLFRLCTVTWQPAMCSLLRVLFSRLPTLAWPGISVAEKCTRKTQG